VTRIHLDTDLGSDTDDLCALAMLLGWPGVEVTGVTTSTDPGGRRAGMVAFALELAGRPEIPVAGGAEGSLGGLFVPLAFPDHWPEPIPPRPGPRGAALQLLDSSVRAGATVVAIGPYTNLAMFEAERPGALAATTLVTMGGHVPPPRAGLPPWGVRDDVNVQQDAWAARIVFERCRPTVVPLGTSLLVTLRERHLAPLRASGPLGRLLAEQGEAHAAENDRRHLSAAYPLLPDDLLNFQYDPLACAVAAGWDGVTIEDVPVALECDGALLRMEPRSGAPTLRIVTDVRAERFEEAWLQAACRASAAPS
jgi:inosine-uridine nucleoside N-ribohydrolase